MSLAGRVLGKHSTQAVTGMDQVAKAFKMLPAELKKGNTRNPLNKALRSGAVVIQKDARNKVPIAPRPYTTRTDAGDLVTVRPGRLQESIRAVYVKQRQRGAAGQVVVKPFGREVRKLWGLGVMHWVPLEFGWTDRGGAHHSGYAFMRRAWEGSKGKALTRIVKRMKTTMENVAKKIRSQTRGR